MKNSPEAIIAEFEFRRCEEKDARKRKIIRRAFDVSQIVIAVVVIIVVAIIVTPDESIPQFLFTPFVVFGYLWRELRKRWSIEDRLEALEQKNA